MQKKIKKEFFVSQIIASEKCCNKLPLLRRESLSLAVNGLTNSPKTLHVTQRDFFNSNILHRDQ